MTIINSPIRQNEDGNEVMHYLGTANKASETYSLSQVFNELSFENGSSDILNIIVGTNNISIDPYKTYVLKVDTDTFSISSTSNSSEFELIATTTMPNVINAIDAFNATISNLTSKVDNNTSLLVDIAINVKKVGATGDGTTDDTASIQNAINSITSGTVYIPEGIYLVGNITLKSNIKLLLSKNATIKAKSTNGTEVITVNGCDNVSIEGGNFISNGANLYIFHGYIYVNNCTNVKINNIKFNSSPCAGVGIENSSYIYVCNCTMTDTAIGVYSKLTNVGYVENNIIIKTTAPGDATLTQVRGVKLITCNQFLINDNYTKNYDIGIEIFNNCNKCFINNNTIISYFGISIDQSNDVICDGNIVNNTQDTNKFLVGIEVAQGNRVAIINNNITIDAFATTLDLKAIHLAPSGTNKITNQDIIIQGNVMEGAFVNTIYVYTVDTFICSNNIFRGGQVGVLIQVASGYTESISTDIDINGNKFYGHATTKNYAVRLTNQVKNIKFKNNKVFNHYGALYCEKSIGSSNISISDNYIYNSSGFAIDIENTFDGSLNYTGTPNTGLIIRNNKLDTGANRGIYIVCIPDTTIDSNETISFQKSGIYIYPPTNGSKLTIIKNNKSIGNCLTITTYEAGIVVNNMPTGTITVIEHNVAINNNTQTGLYLQGTQTGSIVNNNNISSTSFAIS